MSNLAEKKKKKERSYLYLNQLSGIWRFELVPEVSPRSFYDLGFLLCFIYILHKYEINN